MSYTYEALSPGGHQEMLEEVFSKVREQVGSYKTASGSLVSFADGADLPMPSFIYNIDAQQDLHGQDAPWIGGAGKNKLPMTVDGIKAANTDGTWSGNSCVINGITYTILTDSNNNVIGIKANGTASANAMLDLNPTGSLTIPANTTFSLSGCPEGGGGSTYRLYPKGGTSATYDNGSGKLITLDSEITNPFRINVYSGAQVNNIIFYPMIVFTNAIDMDFAPYSNICPISGHTGLDAWVKGKNLWSFGDITQLIDGAAFSLKAGTYTIKADVSNVGTTLVGLRMFYADDTNILVTLSNTNNYQKTFTLTDDVVKINASVTNGTATNVQLELGETATTFEPYNPSSQTISISWQTEAGEVFGGYIDLVSGKLTATHIITTYDGSNDENWGQNTSYNLFNISIPSDYRVEQTPISNLYKGLEPQSASNLSTKANGSFALYSTYGGINIKTDVAEDVAGFKTYLSQNNLQVLYKLATPQTYQLTPTQIKSLLGNNNAWCSTGDIKSLQYQPNNIIAELRDEILSLQEWGFSPIIYSTVEREVGVWIDNKPLYQKTYIAQFPFRISNSGTSINNMIDNYNIIEQISNAIACNSVTLQTSNIFVGYADGLKAYCSEDGYFDTITLWYTKTTDVPGSGEYNTLDVPMVHYSTDEQVIGTWLGETLYRKVFDFSNNPITVQANTWLKVADTWQIRPIRGTLIIPSSRTSFDVAVDCDKNDGLYICSWLEYANVTFLIVEYTKTTD